jgi:hypothetical protein
MSHRSKAHEALELPFAWEGILPKMMFDGANEMNWENLPGTSHSPSPSKRLGNSRRVLPGN